MSLTNMTLALALVFPWMPSPSSSLNTISDRRKHWHAIVYFESERNKYKNWWWSMGPVLMPHVWYQTFVSLW